MDFVPSSGKQEREGIIKLDEWFDYNENAKIDLANMPRCYVHKDCGNLIESIVHYNANGKMDECLKDFFDVLRYFRMANDGRGPDFVNAQSLQVTRKNMGGY
jgi:hypothetical protein